MNLVPKNFCQRSQEISFGQIEKANDYSFHADDTSLYIVGESKKQKALLVWEMNLSIKE